MTGFLVFALCGLTSFNPVSIYSHLAYLENGTLELAQSNPAPQVTPAAAQAAGNADAIAAATTSQIMNFRLTENGDTIRVISAREIPDGVNTKTEIEFVVDSTKLKSEAGACGECVAFLNETKKVTVDLKLADLAEINSDENTKIKDALIAKYNDFKSLFEDQVAEHTGETCKDFDYREGKKCFEARFKLAEECSKRSSRSSRRSSQRTADKIAACEDAPDLEEVIEDFKTWSSLMVTDEEHNISISRIKRLKDVSRNREVAKHVDELVRFKNKYEQWDKYNKTFGREMNALRTQIEDIDQQISSTQNPQARAQLTIRRKQLITDAEAGAQKYQRAFKAAFPDGVHEEILDSSAMIDEIGQSYTDIVSSYEGLFTQQRLLDISSSSDVSTPGSRQDLDISGLTQARQSRGYIDNYDYSSLLRSNFTADIDMNGQRNYNSADPMMTQYQPRQQWQQQGPPQQRFSQPQQGGRNWNAWRPTNQQFAGQQWQPNQFQQGNQFGPRQPWMQQPQQQWQPQQPWQQQGPRRF